MTNPLLRIQTSGLALYTDSSAQAEGLDVEEECGVYKASVGVTIPILRIWAFSPALRMRSA
jgi:hypothetical protein